MSPRYWPTADPDNDWRHEPEEWAEEPPECPEPETEITVVEDWR